MKIEELCSDLVMLPEDHKESLEKLIAVLNPIEDEWVQLGNEPWKITSGYRFLKDHVEIYNKINETRKKLQKKPLPTPMRSNHLTGNAVDIFDPKQDLKFFVSEYLHLFEAAGVYMESFKWTPTWVHMQRIAPPSQNRFFSPF